MRRIAGVVLVLIVVTACDRSAPRPKKEKELETVDIGGGFDAGLSTDSDERAKQVTIDVGGVLPSDFPSEMPLFSPSSIVDFGPGFVEVDTSVPAGEVGSSLGALAQRAGWSVDSIGGGTSTYVRGEQRVKVQLTEIGSGTRIRYEY